jgi:hypothetical protein
MGSALSLFAEYAKSLPGAPAKAQADLKTRLSTLAGPYQKALAANGPMAEDLKKKMAAVVALSRDHQYYQAAKGLDGLEALLAASGGVGLAPAAATKAAVAAGPAASGPGAPAAIQSLIITPANAKIPAGGTLQLNADGLDAIGDPIDMTTDVDWQASSASINFDAPGLARALPVSEPAPVVITATHSDTGYIAKTTLTIEEPKEQPKPPAKKDKPQPPAEWVLQKITISPQGLSINAGERVPFEATGHYAHGSETFTQLETEAVTWTSDNNAVSIDNVDNKGVATAADNVAGRLKVTITATDPNTHKFASAEITVEPAGLQAIMIDPPSATIMPTAGKQFKAFGLYSDGRPPEELSQVTWRIVDPKVAYLGKSGVVFARHGGTTTLEASSGNTTGTATVFVPWVVTAITIEPQSATLIVGGQQRFKAMGVYEGTKETAEVRGVTWTPEDKTIVRIDDEGLATALAPGTKQVTALHVSHSGKHQAKATVTVTPRVLQSVELQTAGSALFTGSMVLGERVQFIAVGVFSDGSGQPHREELNAVDWTVDSKNKAAWIDAFGMTSALQVGRANVTVKDKSTGKGIAFTIAVTDKQPGPLPGLNKAPKELVQKHDVAQRDHQSLLKKVHEMDVARKQIPDRNEIMAEIDRRTNLTTAKDADNAGTVKDQLEGFKDMKKQVESGLKPLRKQVDAVKKLLKGEEHRHKAAELMQKAIELEHTFNLISEAVTAITPFAVLKVGHAINLLHKIELGVHAATELGGEITTIAATGDVGRAEEQEDQAHEDITAALNLLLEAIKEQLDNDDAAIRTWADRAQKARERLERQQARVEEEYDQSPPTKGATKGKFKFAALRDMVEKTLPAIDKVGLASRKSSELAKVAIENYMDRHPVAPDSELGRILHAMNEAILGWNAEARFIAKQMEDRWTKYYGELRGEAFDRMAHTNDPRAAQ